MSEIEKLMKQTIKVADGRRIPKEQPLFLQSLDFAAEIIGLEPGCVGSGKNNLRVKDVSNRLMAAAQAYYIAMDRAAMEQRKRGRPGVEMDVDFVFTIATGLGQNVPDELTFRNYKLPSGKDVGGKERPTRFQEICNAWMDLVDPDRAKLIQAAAFKTAGARWRGHRQE